MLKIKFDFSKCASIEVLIVLCIVVGTILQNGSLISLCFALSFIVLLVYLFIRTLTNRFDLVTLMLIIITVVCVLLNSTFSGHANIGFNYFKKMFMFIAFCLMFSLATDDRLSCAAQKVVNYIPVFASGLLLASYFIGFNTVMLGKHLTLGFSNPNFAGMWLMHFFIYSFLCVADKSANKLLRAICVIMIPAIVYLIVLTKARSALLGIVVMGVYYILLKIIKNNALKRFVVFFALIFPLIFAYAYQLLLDSDWFIQAFEFMASEGKELDSRLGVWLPAMDAIRSSPIWGDYSGISHGTGMSQMHNIHLDVFASYGVIAGVCFISLLTKKTFAMLADMKQSYQRCALSGWIAVFVAGSFEAAVVSGAMGMNILTALLLGLCRCGEGKCYVYGRSK